MDEIEKEIARFREMLEGVVKLSRVPVRDLEERLDYGAGTLNRLFGGRIELKLRHILRILDAIQIKSSEFFAAAYAEQEAGDPRPVSMRLIERFHQLGYSRRAPRLIEPMSDEELDERIAAALERILADRGTRQADEAASAGRSGAAAKGRKARAARPASAKPPKGRKGGG